jgi:hypothetical protein
MVVCWGFGIILFAKGRDRRYGIYLMLAPVFHKKCNYLYSGGGITASNTK